MQLRYPEVLLIALPALALTLLALRWSAVGLSRRRWALSGIARVLLVLALAAAAAELRLVLPHSERAVVFLVDVSESVSPTGRRHVLEWAKQAWEGRHEGDRAGVVVFGREARQEVPLGREVELREPSLEGLGRDRTALDRGLRLAGALLRDAPGERRVVLLSDGNTPREPAEREARALASAGVVVDAVAVPLEPAPGEVVLGEVTAPPVVSEDQPFLLDIEVLARRGGPAVLHVVRNGRYLPPQPAQLSPGLNRVTVEQRIPRSDVFTYEVWVEAPGDGNTANNRGGAIVRVRGRPRVLLALGDERDEQGEVLTRGRDAAAPLAAALEASGYSVTARGEEGLPLDLAELAGYDAFVFGDVSAERWTLEQMEAARRYVFEQGGGLLALGGPRSYGLGGYYRTPVEEALPLSSDVRGKKVLPSLALVLCIDRSGSMSGSTGQDSKLDLAKEGATRALELLQPFDQAGVVAFDHIASWAVPLQRVEQRARLKSKIRAIDLGGGTRIGAALDEAYAALRDCPSQLKHVVLLTDGRSDEGPDRVRSICSRYRGAQITLTTVGVGEGVDKDLLEDLARGAGGRYLFAKDERTLPRLLTKEAVAASQALLIERELVPRHRGQLASLELDWAHAPPLLGYVLTAPKPMAEVLLDTGPGEELHDGPLLARWRYGLGKSAAFASDGTARWCARWLDWPGYGPLFSAMVRWVAREPQAPGFSSELTLEEGRARLDVQVRRPDGTPADALELGANISGPPGAPPLPRLALRPIAPGRYRAEAEVQRPGAYFATVDLTKDGRALPVTNAGAVLAYPREYRHLSHDQELLSRLAELGGGAALSLDDDPGRVFGGDRVTRYDYRPLAWLLFPAAAALLLLELCARRLVLPETALRLGERWRARRASRAAAPGGLASGETLRTLRDRKVSERAAAEAARRDRSERTSRVELALGAEEEEPPPSPGSEPSPPLPVAPPPVAPPPVAPATPPAPPTTPPPSAQPPSAQPPSAPPPPDGAPPAGSMSKLLDAKRKARRQRGRDA
ncbi:MAG: VWA domain-containing protein [Planctomycetota bacterium]